MSSSLRCYTCTVFEGHWPVGTAAVVWATSPEQAAERLKAELHVVGLGNKKGNRTLSAEDMEEFKKVRGAVSILNDGDY
jgi:hypothetical protein